MPTVGDIFRGRMGKALEASRQAIADPNFNADPRIQAAFIVGETTANFLAAMADFTDYIQTGEASSKRQERIQRALAPARAARVAAARGVATGKWDEFNKIVEQFGLGTDDGTDGADPGGTNGDGD